MVDGWSMKRCSVPKVQQCIRQKGDSGAVDQRGEHLVFHGKTPQLLRRYLDFSRWYWREGVNGLKQNTHQKRGMPEPVSRMSRMTASHSAAAAGDARRSQTIPQNAKVVERTQRAVGAFRISSSLIGRAG